MNQILDMKLNRKFIKLLSKMEKPKISRDILIQTARFEYSLTIKQAAGLIDRGIFLLKKHDLVYALGANKAKNYIFSLKLLKQVQNEQFRDSCKYLNSEIASLEVELSITRYEFEAYDEMRKVLPHKLVKINGLQESATIRMQQLNGKIRAFNQMIAE